jgi:cyclophilin family peptidyl-prolyl cis-trans isomerase
VREVKAAPEEKGIRRLEYGDFFGRVVDVTSLFPAELEEGIYMVRWRAGNVTSRPLPVVVIADYRVKVETNRGDFTIELFPRVAPRTVLNFVALVRQNFYTEKGKTFHRILKNRLIQGGCPNGDGTGGTPRIPDEFSPLIHHAPGVVSMARLDEPNSGSCQFFICASPQPHLDRRYSAFGRVTEEGMETIVKIARSETQHDRCPKCEDGPCKLADDKCGEHHSDRPLSEVVMKKVTLEVIP